MFGSPSEAPEYAGRSMVDGNTATDTDARLPARSASAVRLQLSFEIEHHV